MFKNIATLLILVFLVGLGGQTFAITEPKVSVDPKLESDSTNVKNKELITVNKAKPTATSNTNTDSKLNFWESEEEVEEDSSSNSALSFNFIYYIIEKFKFQVE